ncbi:MAG TPA: hypothetical protein VGE77_12020 [Nocardioides sp.]
MTTAEDPDPAQDVLGGAPTVDDVVAALRDDPVLVHPLFGNGARDDVDAAITAKVEQAADAGVPVYVALVPGITGLAEGDYGAEAAADLAVRLADELGPGYYFTAADPHSLAPSKLATGAWEGTRVEFVPGQSDAGRSTLAADVAWGVDQLAENGEDPGQYLEGAWAKPEWQYDRDESAPEALLTTMVPTLTLVLVGIGVALLLRTVARWEPAVPLVRSTSDDRLRKGGRRSGGERGEATSVAQQPLDEVVRAELAAVESLRERRANRAVDPAVRERIDGSYAAAQALLDAPGRGTRRDPDLVGALVLTRIARTALDTPGAPLYRPCYVNPLHGRAMSERSVDDTGVDVPVCRACSRGAAADPFQVRKGWGRQQPYYVGESVWARTGYGALSDDLWSEVVRARRNGGTS